MATQAKANNVMQGTQLDVQLCRQCRGRCCLGHPGVWSDPQRFFSLFFAKQVPTVGQMTELLHKQQLTLRNLGGVLIPAPRSSEQGCAAQRLDGCTFSTEERPCQCLALAPNMETLLDDQIHCSMPPDYGSNTARKSWRPFQELLNEVRI